jgi:hypothetical protein
LSGSATFTQHISPASSLHVKERTKDKGANDSTANPWLNVQALAASVSPVPHTLYQDSKQLVQHVYTSNLDKFVGRELRLGGDALLAKRVGEAQISGGGAQVTAGGNEPSSLQGTRAACAFPGDQIKNATVDVTVDSALLASGAEGKKGKEAALEQQRTMLFDCIQLASQLSQLAESCVGTLAAGAVE